MLPSPVRLLALLMAGALALAVGFLAGSIGRHHGHGGVFPDPASRISTMAPLSASPIAPAGSSQGIGVSGSTSTNATPLPSWAVAFGSEFWRKSTKVPSPSGTGVRVSPSLDAAKVSDAIERVSHAFKLKPTASQAQVASTSYRATLDGEGLVIAPAKSSGAGSALETRLRTSSVQRGGKSWSVTDPSFSDWVFAGNTAQTLLEAELGMVTHYEARRAGVEITWVLAHQPAGDGDLEIGVDVAGLHYVGQTAEGLHFADIAGVSRLKIGTALAVDQRGSTWPVVLAMADGKLVARISAEALAQARYPLAIDPLISEEFGTDQPLDSGSPCTLTAPAVAAGDGGYLVVWTHGQSPTTDPAVCAARVSFTGELLDPDGIVVSTVASEQTTCAVAANPGGFLVVWSSPEGTSTAYWNILGARVRSDGTVLDVPPLSLTRSLPLVRSTPAVAANGTNYLAVWRDTTGSGILGTLVSTSGVVSVTGISVSTAANDQYQPAVASLGGNYLVAWQDYRNGGAGGYHANIYAARVTGSGQLVDANGIAVCTQTNTQFHPAVAANGTNFLVVWEGYGLAGDDICGARINPGGIVLDTNALVISQGSNSQLNPAATSVGGEFFVVWQDYRNSPTNDYEASIYGTRVQEDGTVADPDGIAFSTGSGQAKPGVAGGPTGVLAVWQDTRNNPTTTLTDIYGVVANIGASVGVQADFALDNNVNAQSAPSAAALGTNYLVVWADSRNQAASGQDIYGVRLTEDGNLIDTNAIPICTATNDQGSPAVAANGANYLVVWTDWRNKPANVLYGDIYGSVVSAEGVVQQTNGFPICTSVNDQVQPKVSLLGTNFLVVWQDARNSTASATNLDVYGARVAGTGAVLDPAGFAICTNAGAQTTPAVAGNQNQALVVWSDARVSAATADIYGARLSADGTVIDTNGFVVCVAPGLQSLPAVATDGQDYLVAWADARSSANFAPGIYTAIVDADASVQPTNGFPIRNGTVLQSAPAIAFNGANYLVSWQEARPGFSTSFDIAVASVSLAGSAGPEFTVTDSSNSSDYLLPAVAAAADGRFLVLDQTFGASGRRVTGRILVNPQAIPSLSSASVSGQGFQFVLNGALGAHYEVEVSSDLEDWVQIETFTNSSATNLITDTLTTNLPCRFYRAILLP